MKEKYPMHLDKKAVCSAADKQNATLDRIGRMAQMFAIGTCPTNAFGIR